MRLKGTLEPIPSGWVDGIQEDAEPGAGYRKVGFTTVAAGVMDSCVNFVRSTSGRMAVRGGMREQLALTNDVGAALTSTLTMARYSQDGAVIVGHDGAKAWAFLYDGELEAFIARTDLGWVSATLPHPRVAELFEKVYIADATLAFGSRQQLVALDSAGNLTAITQDLGSGAEALRPFCHAVYNNTLFIAGHDAGQANAPAMIRHSFLGNDPSQAGGFDVDAFNTIGASGERVTAMVPGRNILLIAKENELYRLSGFGARLSGWQFAVQPIDNTDYVGVTWPGALAYAEGYWYGIGRSGPFRTDGTTVELMVSPRLRSWRSVIVRSDATWADRSFVRYDPDRRIVIFGLVQTGETDVQTLWLWHIDAEVWASDLRLPVPVKDVFALAQQGLAGPARAPFGVTVNHAAATFTSVAGTVTLGDSTADTEIWANPTGVYTLQQTLGPGVTDWSIAGLSASRQIDVKARHVKNGQPSGYSASSAAYTLVAAPTLSASPVDGTEIDLTVVNQAQGATVTLQRAGATIKTWTNAAAGGALTYQDTGLSGFTTYQYSAVCGEPTWPSSIATSGTVTAQATTGSAGLGTPGAPVIDNSAATLSAIHASFTPFGADLSTEVWIDRGGGFVLDQTLTPGVAAFTTVGALQDSSSFPVKLRHKDANGDTSAFSASSTGYTLLAPAVIGEDAPPFGDTVYVRVTVVRGTLVVSREGVQIFDQYTDGTQPISIADTPGCGASYVYTAVVDRVGEWPSVIDTSASRSATLDADSCGPAQ